MANLLLFKTIICPISERKDRTIQSLLKNFQLREQFFAFHLFGLQFYFQGILFLFFQKNKCFALKQVQYTTVIRYMPRVLFRRIIFPFFSISTMSIALQSPTHPARLNTRLLQREAFLRCFKKNLFF